MRRSTVTRGILIACLSLAVLGVTGKAYREYRAASDRVSALARACAESGKEPCFVVPPPDL